MNDASPDTTRKAAAAASTTSARARPEVAYERTIFFVSDGTGITAETFGHSLLTQFEPMKLRQVRLPFVDSPEKARQAVERIDRQALSDGTRPVVFSTLIDPSVNDIVRMANCRYLDLFATFVEPLESEFGVRSSHTVGRSHTATDTEAYQQRIAAINYALAHDDGQTHAELDHADVILIGVSRSGKTPTSLYLAMQHGIRAANYPLIPDDFERGRLPEILYRNKKKLFGLSIAPERLAEIRHERRPGSQYASLENCRYEVRQGEALMRREGIRWLSSTTKSIEEIAMTVLHELDLT